MKKREIKVKVPAKSVAEIAAQSGCCSSSQAPSR